jgi:hypothetical protein
MTDHPDMMTDLGWLVLFVVGLVALGIAASYVWEWVL